MNTRGPKIQDDSGGDTHDRWWKKWALGIGAAGAAIIGGTFACGSTTSTQASQASAAKMVSAQAICRWRHRTEWRDNLDEGNSYTYGSLLCTPNRIRATCRVEIQMDNDRASDYVNQRQGCNASAQLPNLRPLSTNWGSQYRFTMTLLNRRARWTAGFENGSKPNRACRTKFNASAQHMMICTNEHEDGLYLPVPTRR